MDLATLHEQPESEIKRCVAIYALWCSGSFDTLDIANLLGMDGPMVHRTIHALRGRERVQL